MRRHEIIILISVIILVFLLFIIYVLASLFFPNQQTSTTSPSSRPNTSSQPFSSVNTELPLTAPSPTVLPSSLPEPINQISKQDLMSLLPIETDFANIEYLSSSDSFAITIKKNPYSENRARVEEWFRSQGFNPSELNIYWQTYPEVTTE